MLWHQWGKVDPVGALDQIRKERDGAYRGFVSQITGVVFSAWAEADPDGARAYVDTIEDDEQFHAAFVGLVSGMDLSDAAGFADAVEYQNDAFADSAGRILAERSLRELGNTEAVADWFATIGNDQLRQGALPHVFRRLRNRDIDLAAGWVSDRAVEGLATTPMVNELVGGYVKVDGLRGLDWYRGLPAGARSGDGLAALLTAAQAQSGFAEWSSDNGERLAAARRELDGGGG